MHFADAFSNFFFCSVSILRYLLGDKEIADNIQMHLQVILRHLNPPISHLLNLLRHLRINLLLMLNCINRIVRPKWHLCTRPFIDRLFIPLNLGQLLGLLPLPLFLYLHGRLFLDLGYAPFSKTIFLKNFDEFAKFYYWAGLMVVVFGFLDQAYELGNWVFIQGNPKRYQIFYQNYLVDVTKPLYVPTGEELVGNVQTLVFF